MHMLVCLNNICLVLYYMYVSNEGSDQTVKIKLALTFTADLLP